MDVRVLLVEDDAVTAKIIEVTLKNSGNLFKFFPHRVKSLSEGQAAIDANDYDCILLDLILPPHNIDETFEWVSVNKWDNRAVVVVMTGYDKAEVLPRMQKYDMQFLVLKNEMMEDVKSISLILLQAINQSILNDVKKQTSELKRLLA